MGNEAITSVLTIAGARAGLPPQHRFLAFWTLGVNAYSDIFFLIYLAGVA